MLPFIYKFGLFLSFISPLNPWFFANQQWLLVGLSALCVIAGICMRPVSFTVDEPVKVQIFFFLIFYISISLLLNIFGLIVQCANFLIIVTLLCLRHNDKIETLQFVTKGLAWISVISLCAFVITFIIGLDLPYIIDTYVNYTRKNYFFFLTPVKEPTFLFPRFESIFMEPGHYGMIISFLLYAQGYDMKKWYNIVLMIGAILSMSLAAYVLILIGLVLKFWSTKKKYILIFTLLCGAFVLFFNHFNDGNNMVKALIIDRLKIEDGELAGNNRVMQDFEFEFERKAKTSDILLGWQPGKSENFIGNAGYKVYISNYGLIGLLICLICSLGFCNGYQIKQAFFLFLLYGAAFLQRAYPFWTAELIIFICGLPYLCAQNKKILE